MKKPHQPDGFLPSHLLYAQDAHHHAHYVALCHHTSQLNLDFARVAARDQESRVIELLTKTAG